MKSLVFAGEFELPDIDSFETLPFTSRRSLPDAELRLEVQPPLTPIPRRVRSLVIGCDTAALREWQVEVLQPPASCN